LVLPRRLTPDQKKIISNFLKQFESFEVSFQVLRNEEASQFSQDLQDAIRKGGWTILPTSVKEVTQEGLNIRFTQTTEHAQRARQPADVNPDRLLLLAFGMAGVRVNGTGGGNGVGVTKDSLEVQIGPRRRDTYELTAD
jgi:hypothetical protein